MQLESPWCLVWVLGQGRRGKKFAGSTFSIASSSLGIKKKVGLGALIGQSLFEDIHINVCIQYIYIIIIIMIIIIIYICMHEIT